MTGRHEATRTTPGGPLRTAAPPQRPGTFRLIGPARAAAVAHAHGPAAGLTALDEVRPAPGEHRHLVLRAELHARLGHLDLARGAMTEAVRAAGNPVERRHLQRRLTDWADR